MSETPQPFDMQDAAQRAQNIMQPAAADVDLNPLPNEAVLDKAAFHERAESAVTEALESGQSLTAIFIDIDGFKAINDELSHEDGDVVIEDLKGLFSELATSFRTEERDDRVADIVGFGQTQDDALPDITQEIQDDEVATKNLSPTPVPGHIGGDEFAVLAHTDEVGAKVIIERLRGIFDTYINKPENRKLKDLNVGMAIGFGVLKESKSQMLADADAAMYDNKIDNIPDLDDEAKRDLRTIRFLSDKVGIRLRDLPKYFAKLQKMDSTMDESSID